MTIEPKAGDARKAIMFLLYRAIKQVLCTWRLQYKKTRKNTVFF